MGNLNDAQGFFSDAGYACKSNYNPADHYIWELSIIEGWLPGPPVYCPGISVGIDVGFF